MPCGASLEIGWIPVRRTVNRKDDVHASDHVDIAIRLLPILEKEAQDHILVEELEQRGWTRQPDGSLTRTLGDVVATLPKGGNAIRIEISAERTVTASATVEGRAPEDDKARQDAIGNQAANKADRQLADKKAEAEAQMIRDNIRRLEQAHEELQAEIAEVATIVTRRSLRERAAQIGAIQSENETHGENGLEVQIVVRT